METGKEKNKGEAKDPIRLRGRGKGRVSKVPPTERLVSRFGLRKLSFDGVPDMAGWSLFEGRDLFGADFP